MTFFWNIKLNTLYIKQLVIIFKIQKLFIYYHHKFKLCSTCKIFYNHLYLTFIAIDYYAFRLKKITLSTIPITKYNIKNNYTIGKRLSMPLYIWSTPKVTIHYILIPSYYKRLKFTSL